MMLFLFNVQLRNKYDDEMACKLGDDRFVLIYPLTTACVLQ